MKRSELMQIISEEIEQVVEASISKKFKKATEALYDIQLKQQQIRKQFVAEKDPKKREKLKQELISMHKVVQRIQSAYEAALAQDPARELEEDASDINSPVTLRTALTAPKNTKMYEIAKSMYETLAETLTEEELLEKIVFYRDKKGKLRRFNNKK